MDPVPGWSIQGFAQKVSGSQVILSKIRPLNPEPIPFTDLQSTFSSFRFCASHGFPSLRLRQRWRMGSLSMARAKMKDGLSLSLSGFDKDGGAYVVLRVKMEWVCICSLELGGYEILASKYMKGIETDCDMVWIEGVLGFWVLELEILSMAWEIWVWKFLSLLLSPSHFLSNFFSSNFWN